MLFCIQFPFSDLRAFLDRQPKVLGRPTWPAAAPDQDFVRSFGPIRRRKLRGLDGWVGEGVICDAGGAIKFAQLPTFVSENLRVPLRIAYRRFYFDGLALGKLEIGIANARPVSDNLTRTQSASLIEHILSTPVTVGGISSKAVIREGSYQPVRTVLGKAGKHIARLYAASTISHPPRTELVDWWVLPATPMLFLVQSRWERFLIPYHGLAIPAPMLTPQPGWTELIHCEVPYRGGSLRMWTLRLGQQRKYRDDRAIKICLLRLHAEQECLRLVLQNVATKRIQPEIRGNACQALQHYLNLATKRISGLNSEGAALVPSGQFAEIARQSEKFINPGESDALLQSLKNLDLRLNILNKVRDYVQRTIEIHQLHVEEMKMDTGDTYNISGGQNIGFGRDAQVYDNAFTQWQNSATNPDLKALAEELATVRAELRKQAMTADHDAAIGAVALAEKSANNGEGAKAFQYLAAAGKWALDVAVRIGTPLAIDAMKKALGA